MLPIKPDRSFNADRRSRWINTEIGVLIHSPELAAVVADFIEDGMAPENSYAVTLNPDGGAGRNLRWTDVDNGESRVQYGEPDAPAWLVAGVWLLSLLPIDDQL